jgi:hypothetical protein
MAVVRYQSAVFVPTALGGEGGMAYGGANKPEKQNDAEKAGTVMGNDEGKGRTGGQKAMGARCVIF